MTFTKGDFVGFNSCNKQYYLLVLDTLPSKLVHCYDPFLYVKLKLNRDRLTYLPDFMLANCVNHKTLGLRTVGSVLQQAKEKYINERNT